ncbi:hypothetical protein IMZ48_29885, partial [Candidatus Bathyarchaeota archaeon]|nr:hypothetical protein [Candidatus Bathyarchaeota archaeon]
MTETGKMVDLKKATSSASEMSGKSHMTFVIEAVPSVRKLESQYCTGGEEHSDKEEKRQEAPDQSPERRYVEAESPGAFDFGKVGWVAKMGPRYE